MTNDRLSMLHDKLKTSVKEAVDKGDFFKAALIVDNTSPRLREIVFGNLARIAYDGLDDQVFERAKGLVADGKSFDALENLKGIRIRIALNPLTASSKQLGWAWIVEVLI